MLTRFLFENKKKGDTQCVKLLLGTTALAAAGAFSASVALAQPSIKGGYEFTYKSQDSGIASSGSSFDQFTRDVDVTFGFTNKTDQV